MRVGETFVGMAYELLDVAQFLRRAGMEGVKPGDIVPWNPIEWRGGGPASRSTDATGRTEPHRSPSPILLHRTGRVRAG